MPHEKSNQRFHWYLSHLRQRYVSLFLSMATRLRIDGIRGLQSESYPNMLYKSHPSVAIEPNCRTTDKTPETRCPAFAPIARRIDPSNDQADLRGEILAFR